MLDYGCFKGLNIHETHFVKSNDKLIKLEANETHTNMLHVIDLTAKIQLSLLLGFV